MDLSPDEAFRLLLDYLKGRGVVVLRSDSPSFIRGVFGSWTQMVLDNAKGVVRVNIEEREEGGGCSVDVRLSFLSELFVALVLTVVVGVSVFLIYGMLGFPSMDTWFVILAELVIIWGIVGVSLPLTKRKFMKDFDTFMQSHSAKKQN